jgi:hypothetical protein
MKTIRQPKPKKGFEFEGWATFNWGICHQRVYRTKKEAIQSCLHMGGRTNDTWDKIKDYFVVVKVKCIVI